MGALIEFHGDRGLEVVNVGARNYIMIKAF
jgi:hypothetical protein